MSTKTSSVTPAVGKVITFYSFKGGVGRTMALANVAFLAAMSGKRVLVMDWDLEAPGLAYYFRTMLDAPIARKLRNTPGLLDIVCEWNDAQKIAGDDIDRYKSYLANVMNGSQFSSYVCDLPLTNDPKDTGVLHYIGAGGTNISTSGGSSYEEALAQFSWANFFDGPRGGILLEELRRWAKENYDYVLIDSRTGLADVAGICTMQMPDAVALCFVLNRQNIEGVARVARAIRARRNDAIKLHPIPMRVAREGTAEQSDAYALASRVLSRAAGVTAEAMLESFGELEVAAQEGIPFYESLAPFNASKPEYDFATLNYLQLGSLLLGTDLQRPALALTWVESTRRRQQPNRATVEYIEKLVVAEPARRDTELRRLIDSAHQALELDDDESPEYEYVKALAEFTMKIEADDSEFESDSEPLKEAALDLVRTYLVRSPESVKAKQLMAATLQRRIDEVAFYAFDEDALPLYEELDAVLAEMPNSEAKVQRIKVLTAKTQIFLALDEATSANRVIGELRLLVAATLKDVSLTQIQRATALIADVQSFLFSGHIAALRKKPKQPNDAYKEGLSKLLSMKMELPADDFGGLLFELCVALATLPDQPPEDAANFAIQAYSTQIKRYDAGLRFDNLADLVLKVRRDDFVRRFCENVFRAEPPPQFYYAGWGQDTPHFLSRLCDLAGHLRPLEIESDHMLLQRMLERAGGVVRFVTRRRPSRNEKFARTLDTEINKLLLLAELNHVEESAVKDLKTHLNAPTPGNLNVKRSTKIPKAE